ncbi:response regulator transcription factor [Salibacterium halotolerans]|uniref:Two-component system, response regulator YesN n=1 Tax=Salibacterium halotolerans TaxID=1884432 RepID=A0A1I5LJK0_9BACI|nr:response regulator [Salibacterium halotolerans]SFO97343.1 two-component system, response regulator YesN [Salibacterium halotolerans]
MNVMIAEDELLERKAMRRFLEEQFSSLVVTAEAVNGRMAVELAATHEPDIILMDIKMPGIDGMQAVERIQTFLPSVHFIMVTAYDSFDYAKQAMKLGVREYILKPGKKEETIEAVQRVMDNILEEREQHKQKEHNIKLAKQLLLSYIIQDAPGMTNLLNELYPGMESGFFLVIEKQHNEAFTLPAEELSTWTADDAIVNQEEGRQLIVCIMSSRHLPSDEPLRLAKRIQYERGSAFLIGTGKPSTNKGTLSRSYVEALVHLQKSKENENVLEYETHDTLERIREAVQEADIQRAMPPMLQLMDRPEKDRKMEELYYSIKQILNDRRIDAPGKDPDDMDSAEDWFELIRWSCMKIRQHYRSLNKMERTKAWIDENPQASLTLEDAAAHAGISASYFSQLFKTTTGENLTDYVTRHRLEKAVELLKKQAYSLKEISYMVGYKDPNYFSRVFKKHYALSPKQYQNTILKK